MKTRIFTISFEILKIIQLNKNGLVSLGQPSLNSQRGIDVNLLLTENNRKESLKK